MKMKQKPRFESEPMILSLASDLSGVWIRGNKYVRFAIGLSAVLAGVAAALFFWSFERSAQFLAVSAGVLALGARAYQRALDQSKRDKRISEIEQAVDANPGKAKPAWDLASAKLEMYVARNLSHVAWIFVLVLIIMTLGFVMICWGVYKVFSSQSIAPSIVAAASGIVVEFIAATFLLIYRSTMDQAKEYVAMLERINAVGMSAQLLEAIEDADPKVRDKARAELASSLLHMYSRSARKGGS
jgi:membrane protein implicated in regulation of membrane protease activity